MWIFLIGVHASQNFFRRRVASMAIQTPPHRQRSFLVDLVHIGDVAMTSLTGDTLCDVALVVKVRVIGQLVHPHPLNRTTFFEVLPYLLNVWAVSLHNRVTVHTHIHGRH